MDVGEANGSIAPRVACPRRSRPACRSTGGRFREIWVWVASVSSWPTAEVSRTGAIDPSVAFEPALKPTSGTAGADTQLCEIRARAVGVAAVYRGLRDNEMRRRRRVTLSTNGGKPLEFLAGYDLADRREAVSCLPSPSLESPACVSRLLYESSGLACLSVRLRALPACCLGQPGQPGQSAHPSRWRARF